MVFISHDLMFIIKYLCLFSPTFLCCSPLFKIIFKYLFWGKGRASKGQEREGMFCRTQILLNWNPRFSLSVLITGQVMPDVIHSGFLLHTDFSVSLSVGIMGWCDVAT